MTVTTDGCGSSTRRVGEPSLEAGEALSLSLGAILDWPPGEYHVKVIFETTGVNEKSGNFIVGRITTPSQPLRVTGEVKPGDEGATEYTPPKL